MPASVKRGAIERAARAVFGRLGYARASIDQIAAEAGVSTRTLYNHFGDKLGLFSQVLVDGAAEVADTFEQRLAGESIHALHQRRQSCAWDIQCP